MTAESRDDDASTEPPVAETAAKRPRSRRRLFVILSLLALSTVGVVALFYDDLLPEPDEVTYSRRICRQCAIRSFKATRVWNPESFESRKERTMEKLEPTALSEATGSRLDSECSHYWLRTGFNMATKDGGHGMGHVDIDGGTLSTFAEDDKGVQALLEYAKSQDEDPLEIWEVIGTYSTTHDETYRGLYHEDFGISHPPQKAELIAWLTHNMPMIRQRASSWVYRPGRGKKRIKQ